MVKKDGWHKYTGHEWLKGANHEVEVLKTRKMCKETKIEKELDGEGTLLYWVYTKPKVIGSTSDDVVKGKFSVPNHLLKSL